MGLLDVELIFHPKCKKSSTPMKPILLDLWIIGRKSDAAVAFFEQYFYKNNFLKLIGRLHFGPRLDPLLWSQPGKANLMHKNDF